MLHHYNHYYIYFIFTHIHPAMPITEINALMCRHVCPMTPTLSKLYVQIIMIKRFSPLLYFFL